MTLAMILPVLALVFGILAVLEVPSRLSWAGLGVIALAAAGLVK